MKKRILIGALIVIVGIGLVFAMSGCDAIFEALVESASSVSGTVIDARSTAGETLGGLNLTLTSVTDGTYTKTTTTDSTDGSFSFIDLDPEKSPYKITGSGDISGTTYTVIPQNVELDGLFKTLGNVPALAIRVEDAENYAITYILMWPKNSADNDTDRDYDLDLHLSFDVTAQSTNTFYYNGDYGNEGTAGRDQVYFAEPSYSSGGTTYVEQDVDSKLTNDAPGVETISFRDIPVGAASLTDLTAGNGDNDSLRSLFEDIFGADYGPYKWAGYSKAYVDLYDTDPTSEEAKLSDVSPKLYVIQSYFEATDDIKNQSTAKALLLGDFSIPDMDVKDAASLVRTDLFWDTDGYPAYLVMWDGEFYPDGPNEGYTFKTIDGKSFVAFSPRQY